MAPANVSERRPCSRHRRSAIALREPLRFRAGKVSRAQQRCGVWQVDWAGVQRDQVDGRGDNRHVGQRNPEGNIVGSRRVGQDAARKRGTKHILGAQRDFVPPRGQILEDNGDRRIGFRERTFARPGQRVTKFGSGCRTYHALTPCSGSLRQRTCDDLDACVAHRIEQASLLRREFDETDRDDATLAPHGHLRCT